MVQGFLGGSAVKDLSAMQETQEMPWVWSLGWEDPLEEGMATHSGILAGKIPWTEEPERLQSIALHRVEHNWSDWAHTHRGWCRRHRSMGFRRHSELVHPASCLLQGHTQMLWPAWTQACSSVNQMTNAYSSPWWKVCQWRSHLARGRCSTNMSPAPACFRKRYFKMGQVGLL